jgi:predicted ATPase/DNA-binding winged helix-turn-helix (wHTH) protein
LRAVPSGHLANRVLRRFNNTSEQHGDSANGGACCDTYVVAIRFADVEIDVAGREIHCGGAPVAVEPQVFDVLVHLIRNRDRVVPKEDLLDEVWRHRFVTESALSSRVKSARRAIGDNGRDQRMIRTVHGRGYRFVAAVEEDESTPGARTALIGNAVRAAPTERPPVRLPVQTTPFVGRAHEIALLTEQLADPTCRLLTIMGPGGIGKTRLAVEVARKGQADFADGVFFVPLASVSDADQVVYAIARSMRVPLDARVDPVTQLLTHVTDENVLLVLDNLEHLPLTDLVARILASGEHVTVLVTSRERLNLRAEWVYDLGGLGLFAESGSEDANDAVNLFTLSAQRTHAGFAVHEGNEEAVRRICRLVGGMPLALELAAGWSELLSAEEIAAEIERGLDILETDLHDVPERHRSMQAVFDTAWERLTADEQDAFVRLSVFRGGFTRSAAEAVAGAGLPMLRKLNSKSMIAATQDNRYTIHELLRQHGERKLDDSGRAPEACRRHSDHFLRWLSDLATSLKGGRQLATMHDLGADMDNIRVAWNDAIANSRVKAVLAAVEPLWLFFDTRGNVGEMSLLFRNVATAPASQPGAATTYAGLLRACHGMVRVQQGALEDGRALLTEGLNELEVCPEERDHSTKVALVQLWLGWASFLLARNAEADEFGRRGLALYEAAGDLWGVARCQYLIGNNDTALGRLRSAKQVLEACRSTATAIGDRRALALACRNLSILAGWFGDYETARSLIDESLKLSEAFGDRLGMAYAMREIGKLEIIEGKGSAAVETLEASIAITDDISARWESAATADDLGNALAAIGDYQAAERALTTCLAAAEASSNRYYMARCVGDLGALALGRGDLEGAERLLTDAGTRWRVIGHEPYLAWTLAQLGHVVSVDSSRRSQAESFYAEALQLTIRHRLAPFALDVIAGVATLEYAGPREERESLRQLAVHHPAASSATRQRARARLAGGQKEPLAHDLWSVAMALAERFRAE